ncbi:hypothetical protein [Aquirhabdus sp.]|uniref:hypothetical protein n=1 Tax=Aquirhabdus sp. TaxID=2824160 RepID=UPI00396CDE25
MLTQSRKTLILLICLILIAAILGGMFASWFIFKHVDAKLLIQDQKATVELPPVFPARAKILNNLDIMLQGKIETVAPVNQTITVPIDDTLNILATFDSKMPIKMNIPIKDTIPLDQVIHVDSQVQVKVLGRYITLPLRGDIPIKTAIPIELNVPVDQDIDLKFTTPLKAKLKQSLHVPLKADIHTTIPVSGMMSVPVKSDLETTIHIDQPLDMMIKRTELNIPLRTIKLHTKNSTSPTPKTQAQLEDLLIAPPSETSNTPQAKP